MKTIFSSLSVLLLTWGVSPLPAGAQTLSRTTWNLPHLHKEVLEVRLLDPRTGTIRSLAWNEAGRPVKDLRALLDREEEAKLAARRGISPELREVLRRTDPGEIVEVLLWRRAPRRDFREVLEAAERRGLSPEEARKEALQAARDFFRQGNRTLADRLRRAGCEVVYPGGPWPLLFARMRADQVERWGRDPAVDQVYYSFPEWYEENHYAQPTLRSPSCHRRGLTGAGSKVKVMVQDPGHVALGCPYLPPVSRLNSGYSSAHATAVAGNISMRNHSLHYGVAKGLPRIYSASGWGDSGAPAAWDKAIKAGVSFGNCSWWNGNKGRIVGLDRFFDYTIRQFAVMMFKSTGNQGRTSTPYTTTPGNGYNMTNSGCYNDGDSFDWADDKMAAYSSWKNPREGHEKPEVASPGDGVYSTYRTRSPWIGRFGGTSSASPLTCGTAVLMATADGALLTRPEAVKAILMASAWHNVEGAAVLSDKDGAGGVHTFAATEVVRKGHWRLEKLTAASFTGGRIERKIRCSAGDETRVTALWFSLADKARTTDRLMMDLDMVILDPAGKTVAASASAKNPFEIAAFVPAVTGDYTVRLIRRAFGNPSERLALAWSSRSDMAVDEVKLSGTGARGTTMTVSFTDIYHGGAYYAGVSSLTGPPATIPLPGGFALPFGMDALVRLSPGGFPGFFGRLSAKGEARGSIAIPNITALAGRKVWTAMLTLDTSLPQVVEEISPAAVFTIR